MDGMGDISFLSRPLVSRDLLNTKKHILAHFFFFVYFVYRGFLAEKQIAIIKIN